MTTEHTPKVEVLDLNIPLQYKMAYERVKARFPDAILAGGFLRDLYHEKLPKDIDIFVETDGETFDKEELTILPRGTEEHNYETDNSIVCVEDLVFDDCSLPVNLIHVAHDNKIHQRLLRFDFGLNQIGYDGDKVYVTQNWINDAGNQTFTLMLPITPHRTLKFLERYNRFKSKYPMHNLVVPWHTSINLTTAPTVGQIELDDNIPF